MSRVFIEDLGFKHLAADHSVFYQIEEEEHTIVTVATDDMAVTSISKTPTVWCSVDRLTGMACLVGLALRKFQCSIFSQNFYLVTTISELSQTSIFQTSIFLDLCNDAPFFLRTFI